MHGLLYAGELSLLLALRLQPSSARPRRNFSCDPMNSFAAADNANNDDDDDDDDDIDDDIDDDKEYDLSRPLPNAEAQ
nr:hypothetical protein HK105_003615 [Polyrhizophydium stewartii]